MLYGTKKHTIPVGSSTLDCVSFGSGSLPLVIIPGLSFNRVRDAALPLAFMFRIFAKDFKVYIFDRKEHISPGCTIRHLAEDTAAAMKHMGIQDACILGVSQGGMIAQCIAMEHPGLVKKLVLGVTLSRPNDTVRQAIDLWVNLALEGKFKEFGTNMAESMYSEKYLRLYRPLLPLLANRFKPKDLPRFISLAKSCLTWDAYSRLREIRCPTFVIGGSQDKVVTGEASVEIAEKLRCSIHMYPSLGHAAYEEAKDFNQRVYNFFIK